MTVGDYVCLTSQNTQQVPFMYFGYKAFASHEGQVVFNTYSVIIQGKSLGRNPKPVSAVYLLCNSASSSVQCYATKCIGWF